MTLDIRAKVTSSLGDVISASISDDYIQGSGLIKTSGSCEINGLVRPAIGSAVQFYYTKSGITRSVPKRLRVLSFFADPYRKKTSIELGCKLTYLQDLSDPIDWTAFDDEENDGLTEDDQKVIIIPIHASSIMNRCLSRLGITASSVPLTNQFSIETFDFSSGYTSILSDLLVSEGYCGYLDQQEVLQILDLGNNAVSGPVLTEDGIIDVGPINVGELPGDSVVVYYSSLKLKVPDETDVTPDPDSEGEEDPFSGSTVNTGNSKSAVSVAYNLRGADEETPIQFAVFNKYNSSREVTNYKIISVLKESESSGASFIPVDLINDSTGYTGASGDPRKEKVSVVDSRIIQESVSAIDVLGGYITEMLSIGRSVGNGKVSSETKEVFRYDSYGRQNFSELTKVGESAFVIGSLGIPFVYENEDDPDEYTYVTLGASGYVDLEQVVTQTFYSGNYSKTITWKYVPWHESIAGQQTIAAARDYVKNAGDAAALIDQAVSSGLSLDSITVETSLGQRSSKAPSRADTVKDKYADKETGDPYNGYSTNSSSQATLVSGSESAERRTEFSMPYAPDDTFYKEGSSYYSRKSDAGSKSRRFGEIQNRLLLGNRNGMSVQTAPERIPLTPFAPFYIVGAGTAALYRTNAISWTIDPNGIIVSTDALYWGVAGRVA